LFVVTNLIYILSLSSESASVKGLGVNPDSAIIEKAHFKIHNPQLPLALSTVKSLSSAFGFILRILLSNISKSISGGNASILPCHFEGTNWIALVYGLDFSSSVSAAPSCRMPVAAVPLVRFYHLPTYLVT
jgi:hypothetical protein